MSSPRYWKADVPYDSDEYREWNRARMRRYRARIVVPVGDDGDGYSYQTLETSRQWKRRLAARISTNRVRVAQLESELRTIWKQYGLEEQK
jgi:hypothetical protein